MTRNQRYQQTKYINSTGIIHLNSTSLTRPGFLVNNSQNIADIQEQTTPNLELLQDLNQIVR